MREKEDSKTFVIGDDVDLLVLLIGLSTDSLPNLFLLKSGRKNTPRAISDVAVIDSRFPNLKNCILFLHAFSGCDYMSSFFHKGKISAWKSRAALSNDEITSTFLNPTSTHEEIYECGCQFICLLYKASKYVTKQGINFLRYTMFTLSCSKKRRVQYCIRSIEPRATNENPLKKIRMYTRFRSLFSPPSILHQTY